MSYLAFDYYDCNIQNYVLLNLVNVIGFDAIQQQVSEWSTFIFSNYKMQVGAHTKTNCMNSESNEEKLSKIEQTIQFQEIRGEEGGRDLLLILIIYLNILVISNC